MKFQKAFDINPGDVVALIGAGGKTSLMVALGYELAEAGWRVLATTTTRIGEDQLRLMPHAMQYGAGALAISQVLSENRFVFLYDEIRDGKVYGPRPEWIPGLLDSVDSDVLLIEADGARGLPLKAPFPHEPVIPPETSLVVPIASLAVLGEPLDDKHVYNPQAMTDKYGFFPGSRVKSPWVAQVLRDDELGLYGIPPKARVVAFLNQTPAQGYLRGRARMIARLTLRSPRINGVALGSVRGTGSVHEVQRPVGAVVLAAGMSTRMGQPKVLLPWVDGKTILEHILEQLIRTRIDHISVVVGHNADEVKQAINHLGVKIVRNRAYKTGEMLSSLKAGLKSMPDNMAAALVVLGDQPRIQPKVIYQILTAYAEGAGDIVAPSFQMRRGHPMLIGRRFWPEILSLPAKGAPRDVINAHQDEIAYVNVDNDSVLRDIDTPQDYDQERYSAGLGRYGNRPEQPPSA
jgi:molybdenum cofactor cytidylyltransferase